MKSSNKTISAGRLKRQSRLDSASSELPLPQQGQDFHQTRPATTPAPAAEDFQGFLNKTNFREHQVPGTCCQPHQGWFVGARAVPAAGATGRDSRAVPGRCQASSAGGTCWGAAPRLALPAARAPVATGKFRFQTLPEQNVGMAQEAPAPVCQHWDRAQQALAPTSLLRSPNKILH